MIKLIARAKFLCLVLTIVTISTSHRAQSGADPALTNAIEKLTNAINTFKVPDQLIHALKKPSFLQRTASNITYAVATAVVWHFAIRWIIDYSHAKNDEKNKQSAVDQAAAHPENSRQSFTFKNLAGKIPKDVLEITEFIKDSHKYASMGAKMPHGVLLVGPPGTGKTSIARAIAGECNAFFIAVSASQFIEYFVGSGPSRVRDVFLRAQKAIGSGAYKKAIIFIDELDSMGSRAEFGMSNTESRNTLNELLNQMDGFTSNDAIFVLAATNRPQDIDPALKRAGRFDRIVEIGLPDSESREAILRLYAKSIRYNNAVDFSYLAQRSQGMSGAELKNLVNEAAIFAVRAQAKETKEEHFLQAFTSTRGRSNVTT